MFQDLWILIQIENRISRSFSFVFNPLVPSATFLSLTLTHHITERDKNWDVVCDWVALSNNWHGGICLWILLYAAWMTSQTFLIHQSTRLRGIIIHCTALCWRKRHWLASFMYIHISFTFLSLYSIVIFCNNIIFIIFEF